MSQEQSAPVGRLFVEWGMSLDVVLGFVGNAQLIPQHPLSAPLCSTRVYQVAAYYSFFPADFFLAY